MLFIKENNIFNNYHQRVQRIPNLKSVNRDIKLKHNQNGEYDRLFDINGFKSIKNMDTIKNSIIISLMTRLGELHTNPTYKRFGCEIYSYLKQNNMQLTRIAMQETIQRSLNKIKGIKSVEHVQIETKNDNAQTIHINFTATTTVNSKIHEKIEIRSI